MPAFEQIRTGGKKSLGRELSAQAVTHLLGGENGIRLLRSVRYLLGMRGLARPLQPRSVAAGQAHRNIDGAELAESDLVALSAGPR